MAFEYKDKEIEELQNRIDQTNEELDDIVSWIIGIVRTEPSPLSYFMEF